MLLTGEQERLLRLIAGAGGTYLTMGMGLRQVRLLVAVARTLERRGLLRVMHDDECAHFALTGEGRLEAALLA